MPQVLPAPLYNLSLLTPIFYDCSADLKTKSRFTALQKELIRSFIVKCFFYLFEVMKHSLQFLAFKGKSWSHSFLELLFDEIYLILRLNLFDEFNFIGFINLYCLRLCFCLFLILNNRKVVCLSHSVWLIFGFLVTNFYRILHLIWHIFIYILQRIPAFTHFLWERPLLLFLPKYRRKTELVVMV